MANVPDVEVTCPRCGDAVSTNGIYYSYDPGCWRTANGDGWPPSEEFEVEAYEVCACGFDPNLDATPDERKVMNEDAFTTFRDMRSDYDDGPEWEPPEADDGPRSLFN